MVCSDAGSFSCELILYWVASSMSQMIKMPLVSQADVFTWQFRRRGVRRRASNVSDSIHVGLNDTWRLSHLRVRALSVNGFRVTAPPEIRIAPIQSGMGLRWYGVKHRCQSNTSIGLCLSINLLYLKIAQHWPNYYITQWFCCYSLGLFTYLYLYLSLSLYLYPSLSPSLPLSPLPPLVRVTQMAHDPIEPRELPRRGAVGSSNEGVIDAGRERWTVKESPRGMNRERVGKREG